MAYYALEQDPGQSDADFLLDLKVNGAIGRLAPTIQTSGSTNYAIVQIHNVGLFNLHIEAGPMNAATAAAWSP